MLYSMIQLPFMHRLLARQVPMTTNLLRSSLDAPERGKLMKWRHALRVSNLPKKRQLLLMLTLHFRMPLINLAMWSKRSMMLTWKLELVPKQLPPLLLLNQYLLNLVKAWHRRMLLALKLLLPHFRLRSHLMMSNPLLVPLRLKLLRLTLARCLRRLPMELTLEAILLNQRDTWKCLGILFRLPVSLLILPCLLLRIHLISKCRQGDESTSSRSNPGPQAASQAPPSPRTPKWAQDTEKEVGKFVHHRAALKCAFHGMNESHIHAELRGKQKDTPQHGIVLPNISVFAQQSFFENEKQPHPRRGFGFSTSLIPVTGQPASTACSVNTRMLLAPGGGAKPTLILLLCFRMDAAATVFPLLTYVC